MSVKKFVVVGLFGLIVSVVGCNASVNTGRHGDGGSDVPDMTLVFQDDGFIDTRDFAVSHEPTNCGDTDPSCQNLGLGPDNGKTFPLSGDPVKDSNEKDEGLGRDPNGWLGLDQTHASFDFLWIANSEDWSRGTLSKIDSKTIREVARYLSVTCSSLKTGSSQACDGTNGCCSIDDNARFAARLNRNPEPGHQTVNLTSNSPSRTAIDFNGDMFVANRAFSGQSSITKIANDLASCIDRNRNGHIDTSTDVNGDGQIQTDCNGNATLDDIDDVNNKPCINGLKQEFYGLDDECILWTTNTNSKTMIGRPLALGPGSQDTSASDAWAGTYSDGKFFRVDGLSGKTKDVWQLTNGCQPYGLAIDAQGFGWAPNLGPGPLCYFDTKSNKNVGVARDPSFGRMNGYGTCIDRDQNVWMGGWGTGNPYRYTPDRTNGFASIGNGWWTVFNNPGQKNGAQGAGRGIAADSRTPKDYFVWVAKDAGWVSRIDATATPPMKIDQQVDASSFPAFKVAGSNTIGVGVDALQNVWGISYSGSVLTRALIDKLGGITAPSLNTPPVGNNKCPAGDTCALGDGQRSNPAPYTYSDFTGFGLRNFVRPKGSYSYVLKGCDDAIGTQWYALLFDADVPPNTSLTAHVRSGNTPIPDVSWGQWTALATTSPFDLMAAGLQPNNDNDQYIQVEFVFATQSQNATPKLKSFDVAYKCSIIVK